MKKKKISNCWKSLFEAVVHVAGSHYGGGDAIYYQALKWTNMRLNDVIGEVLGYVYSKIPITDNTEPGVYGAFDLEEGKEGARQMKQQGFYIMKKRLPAKYLKEIVEQTKTLHYRNHEKFDPTLRDNSVNFIKDILNTARNDDSLPNDFYPFDEPAFAELVFLAHYQSSVPLLS